MTVVVSCFLFVCFSGCVFRVCVVVFSFFFVGWGGWGGGGSVGEGVIITISPNDQPMVVQFMSYVRSED